MIALLELLDERLLEDIDETPRLDETFVLLIELVDDIELIDDKIAWLREVLAFAESSFAASAPQAVRASKLAHKINLKDGFIVVFIASP